VGDHHVDIDDLDVAVLAIPPAAAETLRSTLIDAGVFVVDLSASGGDGALPLLWPSLGMAPLETHPGGVALPCGIAAALAPLMAALAALGEVLELDVTALMSAQSVGRAGEEALSAQTVALLNQRLPMEGPFGGVLAFNLLPGSHEAVADGDPVVRRATDQLARLLPSMGDVQTSLRVVQVPVVAGRPDPEALAASLEASVDLRPFPDEGRLALRDTMEHDAVFLARPSLLPGGVFDVFVATDPLHRSAWAVGTVLEYVLSEDLW
jgi:aspartate-semialdehyde dehydrogenase